VSPVDLPSFAVTLLVLSAVAGLANFIPAHRASRIDPAAALKGE
jgi:ABC-type antimicrobial peptide transport system permease subunit